MQKLKALFTTLFVLTFIMVSIVAPQSAEAAKQKVTMTDVGTTQAEVLFPYWEPSRTTTVTGYNVTSDKSGAVFNLYERSATGAVLSGANTASGTKIMKMTNTTLFTAGDYVAIVKDSTKAVQWNRITSKTDNVSLNFDNNLTAVTSAGDQVLKLQKIAAIPVGAATVKESGGSLGLFFGTPPLLGLLDGTSACSINFAATLTQ
jgi:hypothetical protein